MPAPIQLLGSAGPAQGGQASACKSCRSPRRASRPEYPHPRLPTHNPRALATTTASAPPAAQTNNSVYRFHSGHGNSVPFPASQRQTDGQAHKCHLMRARVGRMDSARFLGPLHAVCPCAQKRQTSRPRTYVRSTRVSNPSLPACLPRETGQSRLTCLPVTFVGCARASPSPGPSHLPDKRCHRSTRDVSRFPRWCLHAAQGNNPTRRPLRSAHVKYTRL